MKRTEMDADTEALAQAWAALQEYLASRCKALSEEVSHYPTPIAHCDDQLPKLIEQRTRAVHSLRRMNELGPMPSAAGEHDWESKVESFLADAEVACDDDAEAALRARVAHQIARI